MKKLLTLFIFLLTLATALPVSAVSENANENAQEKKASPSPSPSVSVSVEPSPVVSVSASPARNYGQSKKAGEGLLNPRSETAREHMSEVAKVVEELHALANLTGVKNQGFGDQISTIAQNQITTANEANEAIDTNEERGKFVKFLIGPNYDGLENLKQAITNYQTQIQELTVIMNQLTDDADKQQLQLVIQNMQLELNRLQAVYSDQAAGFSMFGWLVKLF